MADDARSFLALTSALAAGPEEVAAAEAVASAQLKRNGKHVPALMIKAALESQRGQAEAAAKSYSVILKNHPDFAPAQKELAALYAKDPEELARAKSLAVKAREVLRSDLELTRTLAEISFKTEDYRYAIQLLDEIAREQSLDAAGSYYRGVSELGLGRAEEAEAALTQAIKMGLQEPLLTDAREALSKVDAGTPE